VQRTNNIAHRIDITLNKQTARVRTLVRKSIQRIPMTADADRAVGGRQLRNAVGRKRDLRYRLGYLDPAQGFISHGSIKKIGFVRIANAIQLTHLLQNGRAQLVDIGALEGGDEDGHAIGLAFPAGAEVGQDLLARVVIQPFIERIFDVKVHLVEDGDDGLVEGFEVLQGLVHHTQLLFVVGMRDVHHMQKDVGLAHLIERAFKALYKMVGQLADEAYRIAEEKGRVLVNELAGRRVQRGKELVLGQHVAFAEQVHEGRFAHVGIAYKGHANELAPVLALGKGLLVDLGQALAQEGDLVAHDTTVGLDLGLTRTAGANAATEAFQVLPHAAQAGQDVLVLGQLHLGLGLGRLGAAGKDVEDEVRTVDGLDVGFLLDVHDLGAAQLIVENEEVDIAVGHVVLDLLELALAHVGAAVGVRQLLYEFLYGHGAGGLRKEGQLRKVFLNFLLRLILVYDTNQYGAFVVLDLISVFQHNSSLNKKAISLPRDRCHNLIQSY